MNLWRSYMEEHRMVPTHAIIGVDPGDTTGLYICVVHEEGVLLDMQQINADAIYPWMQMVTAVLDDCDIPADRKHVAIEKYQITRRTVKLTRQPAAIEVTGVMKAIAHEWNAHVWEFGMATTKKFASDDLLERVGWIHKKGKRSMRHAIDAARQAWTCLAEVDFPTWEESWECVNDATLAGTPTLPSLGKMLMDAMKEVNRDER